MASGGGDPRPEDDPFSDGDTSESDSAYESRPQRMGARRPGATNNPILTRLAVSRNPSPLAAATAAPGVCLLRFAWESAAGSLVGAVVGYGKTHAGPSSPLLTCLPPFEWNLGLGFRALRRVVVAPFRGLTYGFAMTGFGPRAD